MYYVDQNQINARLHFIPVIAEALRSLGAQADKHSLIAHLAQERALYLAIEVVTDVGSLMIDGFMMRDASSYEDIVDVLKGEGVFSDDLAEQLSELVSLRRMLTQNYMEMDRTVPLRADLEGIAEQLERFAAAAAAFIEKELEPFAASE